MPSEPISSVPGRLLLLAGLVPLVAILSIAVGANPTTPPELWHALTAPSGEEADVIVRTLRFPRTLIGLIVGGALGTAGILMQGHTRNAAAEPGLLGVSAGAAFSVVLGLRLQLVETLRETVYAAAFGALVAAVAVSALARTSLREGGPRLVVAGAATTALLSALSAGIVLLDAETLDSYRFWAVGSLSGRGRDTAAVVGPFALAGLVLAAINARSLNILALGNDVATTLGHSVIRARLVGLIAVTLLTAAGVAACGPLAFVGLIAGSIARSIVGASWTLALVAGVLCGALLVVVADVAGRLISGPGELQVGVVVGLLGAPLLVWLARGRGLAL